VLFSPIGVLHDELPRLAQHGMITVKGRPDRSSTVACGGCT
jgi:hypothetical protein